MRWERFKSFMRRNSVTIGFTIIALALGTILFIQAVAMNKLEAELTNQQVIIGQVKNVADQIKQNGFDRSDQINQINRHLDCIVEFFSQRDRTEKAIANIDTCTLQPTNAASGNNSGSTAQPSKAEGTPTPSKSKNGTSQNNSDGGSSSGSTEHPGFLQRNIIQPIKNLINAL